MAEGGHDEVTTGTALHYLCTKPAWTHRGRDVALARPSLAHNGPGST